MTARRHLSKADLESIELLEKRAKSMDSAAKSVGEGLCTARASAAFEECAALLRDAAQNCRDLPFVPSVRES